MKKPRSVCTTDRIAGLLIDFLMLETEKECGGGGDDDDDNNDDDDNDMMMMMMMMMIVVVFISFSFQI